MVLVIFNRQLFAPRTIMKPEKEYSLQCQDIQNLEEYFFEIPVECPYDMREVAVYHQALFAPVPGDLMQAYLDCGYRRNGNYIYNMTCPKCSRCVPIKIRPEEFRPNRNQKRTLKNNRDVSYSISPFQCTEEKLALCNKFLNTRYPGHNSCAQDYYSGFFLNNITGSFEVEYRLGSKLLGVAIIDAGRSWMSAVYFYFDPEEEKRSPGTHNILSLIDICRRKNIPNLYLGYWLKDKPSMKYKANFKPHYVLEHEMWKRVA